MAECKVQGKEMIFALDIGTRSVVGVVGTVEGERLKVLDIEMAEHHKRAMIDGQIDNIHQVAALARTVTQRLEERLGVQLQRVCVAAAGRALRTERGSFSVKLIEGRSIDAEQISRLEAGAVSVAEEALQGDEETRRQFFLVGYTVVQYRLDGYPLSALLEHSGSTAEVDVVATFLPGEVVESLYAAMRVAGLQVASMTLEPIAAMNAAIPAELRLLNLSLVDIGAGTTDIAICKDGSVVGYTMATIAGDEVTEAIMRAYLVDFQTAETIKRGLRKDEDVRYTNILGLEETISYEEIQSVIAEPMERLAEAIASQITSLNGSAPSAVFLAGGGSKLDGLQPLVAKCLKMDEKRVAVAGNNYVKSAFSDEVKLDNPEYATPLGIAVSAGLGLLNDSYIVMLNGAPAKLFRNGSLTLRDVLQMNGYTYADMLGKTGKSLNLTLDGRRMTLRGEPSIPAILTLNDEDVSLTTPVHAGDRIQFTPARSGADAAKTLRELLGPDFFGKALVNNQAVSMDTPLKQGDVILTLEKGIPAREEVRNEPEYMTAPAWEMEVMPAVATSAVVQPVAVAPAPVMAPPPVEEPRPEEIVPPVSFMKPTRVILNEKPLVLPGKENGQPYYLMDLLEHSGLDFDKLDRPVRLEINGVESGFRQVVKDQDTITITCD